MKLELDDDQIFEILDEWCEREHGSEIDALQWQVEDDKKFRGVIIVSGPA